MVKQQQTGTPKRLHLVSEVIFREFCDGGLLMAMNVQYQTVKRIGPGGVCFTKDLNPEDPVEFEELWKTVEDRLPPVLTAIKDRTILQDEGLVRIAKDCLALHVARSKILMQMFSQILPYTMTRTEREMVADPRIDGVFRQLHSGLWPAGSEGRAIAAATMRRQIEEQLRSGAFLAERLVANFHKARDWARDFPLEIGTCYEGEFLIGDTPAQSVKKDHPGVGPLGGVPFDEANMVVMPIGRFNSLSLGREPTYVDVPPWLVERVNRIQVVSADTHVMWHPSADMESFVRAVLAEAATPQA